MNELDFESLISIERCNVLVEAVVGDLQAGANQSDVAPAHLLTWPPTLMVDLLA